MFLFYILEWEGNFSLYCFLLKTESGKQLLLKYNSHAKISKFLEMLKSISKVKPNFMTNTSVRWKVKNVHAQTVHASGYLQLDQGSVNFYSLFFHWIGAQDLNSSLKTLWEAIESYEAK